MKINLFLAFILMIAMGHQEPRLLSAVPELDLNKYAGTWYEIARLPNRFEKGLTCVTATYNVLPNGKINVLNKGHKIEDLTKTNEVEGKAWAPDPKHPARLKVRFFWPFSGNYWVLDLAPDYSYSLVGEPSRKYLWILSRTPTMDQGSYEGLIAKAKLKGFPVEEIIKVNQDCR